MCNFNKILLVCTLKFTSMFVEVNSNYFEKVRIENKNFVKSIQMEECAAWLGLIPIYHFEGSLNPILIFFVFTNPSVRVFTTYILSSHSLPWTYLKVVMFMFFYLNSDPIQSLDVPECMKMGRPHSVIIG